MDDGYNGTAAIYQLHPPISLISNLQADFLCLLLVAFDGFHGACEMSHFSLYCSFVRFKNRLFLMLKVL